MVSIKQDSIDTKHEGPIADLKYDYYGRRLASASQDGSVHIIENNSIVANLSAHNGPVLTLSWTHPKYGSLLASGGADQKIAVWKEAAMNKWQIVYEFTGHAGPITTVVWSPHNLGLVLAASSMDGCISVLTLLHEDKWEISTFSAHVNGALSLCWSPLNERLIDSGEDLVQFVSSGAGGEVKVWVLEDSEYVSEEVGRHRGSARAVVWDEDILSGGDDGVVIRWRKERGGWTGDKVLNLKSGILSICVNECGEEVAVCVGEETKVFGKGDNWKFLYTVDEAGNLKESN